MKQHDLGEKKNASVMVTSWSALESHQTALHIRLLSFPHNTHCLDSSFIITFTCLIILFSSPHISLVFSFIICKVLFSVTLQFRDRERSTRRDLDLGLYFEQNTICLLAKCFAFPEEFFLPSHVSP